MDFSSQRFEAVSFNGGTRIKHTPSAKIIFSKKTTWASWGNKTILGFNPHLLVKIPEVYPGETFVKVHQLTQAELTRFDRGSGPAAAPCFFFGI